MRVFTLVFADDGLGEPKRIQFDGADAQRAFHILGQEREERRVELFEGTKLLGVITRFSEDGWQLG